MSIVALLAAVPGLPRQLIAYAGDATFTDFLDGLRERLAGRPFRVTALDVGAFTIGDDRIQHALPAATQDPAVPPRDVVWPTLQPRALWRVVAEGVRDHLILAGPDVTADEIREVAGRYPGFPSAGELIVIPAGAGVYAVRDIVFSYQSDARWFDESGRLVPAPE